MVARQGLEWSLDLQWWFPSLLPFPLTGFRELCQLAGPSSLWTPGKSLRSYNRSSPPPCCPVSKKHPCVHPRTGHKQEQREFRKGGDQADLCRSGTLLSGSEQTCGWKCILDGLEVCKGNGLICISEKVRVEGCRRRNCKAWPSSKPKG